MEENNNVTNLGNNVGYNSVINTESTQTEQQIPNNETINTNTLNLQNNTLGADFNNNYTNVYNQYNEQVMQSIANNIVNEPQITQADIQAQSQAVQQTQTVINPTQNISIGSPTAQQMAQADVVQTTTTTIIPENLTQTTNIVDNSNTTTQIINETTQEVKTEIEQPVVQDRYILKTEKFAKLLSNANKIAINEGLLPTTTIFQLVFGTDSFKVIATDSSNVLIQTDKSVKFTNPAIISLKADMLYSLVNKLASEYIELLFNKEEGIVTIVSDDASFILQQQTDPNTFEPIMINTEGFEVLPTDTIYTLNIQEFKEKLAHAFTFVTSPKISRKLSGVYCGAEYILASDSSNIVGAPNVPELVNESLYLNEKFVSVITQLDFTGDTKVAIRKDQAGNFVGILVYNDEITLGGPAHKSQEEFMLLLDTILKVFKAEYTDTSITFNKSQVSYMLGLSELFINKDQDKDSCRFEVKGNTLNIQSISKLSKQVLNVTNNNVPDLQFNLKVLDTIKALENCEDTDIVMGIDTVNKKSITLTTPNLKQVIAMINL